MKSAFWISVAAVTVLGISSASAQEVFNYTADGGFVKGSVVDHSLSGPEYDPTKLYGSRGTLMYHSNNYLYSVFTNYNFQDADDFWYPVVAVDPDWHFPTPPDGVHLSAGLSWGNAGVNNAGPFYLDTEAKPVCAPSPTPPAPCLNDGSSWWGQSGAGLRPVTAADGFTVESNGEYEVFGWLVHFNRDIRPKFFDYGDGVNDSRAKGLEMDINWTLHLNDTNVGGDWTKDVEQSYKLYFWETRNDNSYDEGSAVAPDRQCPRTYNEMQDVLFRNGTTIQFEGDGVADIPKPDGAGCDDAWTFTGTPGAAPTFIYGTKLFTIDVKGFYEWEEQPDGSYICNGSLMPINTLWAEENTETVGCVKFAITSEPGEGQGCTPGYWKQYVTNKNNPGMHNWPPAYTPETDFDDAFGLTMNQTGDLTLGDVFAAKGKDKNMFMQHAVAGLLNAAAVPEVGYVLTIGDVQDIVKAVYGEATPALTEQEAKTILSEQNELECELTKTTVWE
jgi:hypothetical protein